MLKGFKEFLLRGNIVDLAVAVVIGTAFTALVASFTSNVINPVIARAGGGGDVAGLYIKLGDSEQTWIDVGDFLTAVITFVITAAVVYFFVVVPMKRVLTRIQPPDEAVAEVTEGIDDQTVLLREIRDALLTGGSPVSGTGESRPPTP
jgi:large conductance mechanosensitive channel